MTRALAAALLLLAPPLAAQLPVEEVRDVPYVEAAGHVSRLDLYRNVAATPSPVVIYFHGGAWSSGQRPASASSFRAFLDLGFSVVSASYRLAGVARAPAAVQDARCAVAWVKANADRYGLDATRIVTHGSSAGAHLALMAAFLPADWEEDLPQCGEVPRVAAVLDFYGPTDLVESAARSERARGWLGGGAGGVEEMARRMSPLRHVRPGVPPVLIVHGDADPTVPYAHALALRDALEAAGVPVRLHTVPGGGHGKLDAGQRRDVEAAVETFLGERGLLPAGREPLR